MVIQENMSPKSIVQIWPQTKEVFAQYDITLTEKCLADILHQPLLTNVLQQLNEVVKSSAST